MFPSLRGFPVDVPCTDLYPPRVVIHRSCLMCVPSSGMGPVFFTLYDSYLAAVSCMRATGVLGGCILFSYFWRAAGCFVFAGAGH